MSKANSALIGAHRNALSMLCREYGVARLSLFGSAATDQFDAAASDLDFVVAFADKSPGYAGRYLDFAEALEQLSHIEKGETPLRSANAPPAPNLDGPR